MIFSQTTKQNEGMMHPHSVTPHSLQDISVGASRDETVTIDAQRRETERERPDIVGALRGVGVGRRLDRLTPVGAIPHPPRPTCADLIVLGQSD